MFVPVYDKTFPILLAFWLRKKGLRTDVEIAERFEVDKSTIGRWRAKYPMFNDAILDPDGILTNDLYDGLKKLVTSDDNEDIRAAINLAAKLGFGNSKGLDRQTEKQIDKDFKIDEESRRESRGLDIYNAWKAGNLSSSDAQAQLQFASLPVPDAITEDLQFRLADARQEKGTEILERYHSGEIDLLHAVDLLEMQQLKVPKFMEIKARQVQEISEEEERMQEILETARTRWNRIHGIK